MQADARRSTSAQSRGVHRARSDRSGARKHPERQVRGERQGLAKLTAAAVVEIRRRYAVGESQLKIGHAFGVSHRAVGYVVNGQTWRHIL